MKIQCRERKWKQILKILILGIVCMISSRMQGRVVHAEVTKEIVKYNDFYYYVNEDKTTVTIDGYTGSGSTVEIPETIDGKSVTCIGDWVFFRCSNLTSITIPSTVTSIEEWAFGDCSNLTNITIPSNVTSIGSGVFDGCSSLESITIPSNVTSIRRLAFCRCSSLESITIPSSVTSIENGAFDLCSSLVNISVDSANTVYDSRDNCNAIIRKEDNTLIQGCKNTVIPSTVTSIGDEAFYGCTSMQSIKIPSSVTSIGEYSFGWCTNLTSVAVPSSVAIIKDAAFYGCSSLTSITIPSSTTSIGGYPFSGCSSLANILVDSANTVYDSRDNCNAIIRKEDSTLILGCKNTVIPSSVTCIESFAFSLCRDLTSITIPSSVTSIEDYAFTGCSSLTSITIPSSVTYIGSYALGYDRDEVEFAYEKIENFIIYGDSDVVKSYCAENEFKNISVAESSPSDNPSPGTNPTVDPTPEPAPTPDSVPSIEPEETIQVGKATMVTIPDTNSGVGKTNVSGKSKDKTVKKGSTVTDKKGNSYVVTNNKKKEIAYKKASKGAAVVIPDTVTINKKKYRVTEIKPNAFRNNKKLKKVVIGNNITKIGDYACAYCKNLKSVAMGKNVSKIGKNAFYGSQKLSQITIHSAKLKKVGTGAFKKISKKPTVKVPRAKMTGYQKLFKGKI